MHAQERTQIGASRPSQVIALRVLYEAEVRIQSLSFLISSHCIKSKSRRRFKVCTHFFLKRKTYIMQSLHIRSVSFPAMTRETIYIQINRSIPRPRTTEFASLVEVVGQGITRDYTA